MKAPRSRTENIYTPLWRYNLFRRIFRPLDCGMGHGLDQTKRLRALFGSRCNGIWRESRSSLWTKEESGGRALAARIPRAIKLVSMFANR